MPSDVTLTVALVSDVFHSPDGGQRLNRRLRESREAGADLAVLPELALNPWSPATNIVRDDDAEIPGGPRHRLLSSAARNIGIAVVGSAIVRDPDSGRRRNTALVFDADGTLVASYAKVHLPDEEGFHEPAHYEPGKRLAEPVRTFAIPIGIQVCSDINRPAGSHVLAAMGAGAIINPRATEAATFDRWKVVFRSTAITTSGYVLSVNRPGPEQGVLLGGPSIAVDPNGNVLLESTAPVAVVTLYQEALDDARSRYPGYLAVNAELYSYAWRRCARNAQGD